MDRSSALTYIVSMALTTMVYIGVDHYQTMGGREMDKNKLMAYALTGAFVAVSVYQLTNMWNSAHNVNTIIT